MGYDILIRLPGLLFSIVVHELAHGYMAYKLGDNTAKQAGRLTINPLKHIDIVGFIFLLIFKFGWAKPVPINPTNFKVRKRDTILVSLAGPFSNLLISLIIGIIFSFDVIENYIFFNALMITLWYNIILGIFNLLPFPPLDGSKIFASFLPVKYEYTFYKNERYLHLILIILVITNTVDKILNPIINSYLNLFIKIIT